MPLKYPEFSELATINKEAVALTGEEHNYDSYDEEGLRAILANLQGLYNDLPGLECITNKVTYLIFSIAYEQRFHEGNKRTALIIGETFLKRNGYTIDIEDQGLLQILDRCAIQAATLKDLYPEIKRLIKNDR